MIKEYQEGWSGQIEKQMNGKFLKEFDRPIGR